MGRRGYINPREVISQEKAAEILGPHEDDLRQPFHHGLEIWRRIGQTDPRWLVTMSARSRATVMFDFIVHEAKARFCGRENEGIRTSDDYNSLLVLFGEDLIVRFKLFDEEGKPSNIPTRRQMMFASQYLELPGMPPEATKLSIGYRLNKTKDEIKDIYITCWRNVTLVWSYPLYESTPSNVLYAQLEAEDFTPPQTIIRPKTDKKKTEGNES